MKKILCSIGIVILTIFALSGCVAVPETHVVGSLGGKPFSVSSPKDSTLVGLDISADTNGTLRVHIDSLSARMNPDVIQQTGAAQTAIIQATGNAVGQVAAQIVQAAVAASGAPKLPTPPTSPTTATSVP